MIDMTKIDDFDDFDTDSENSAKIFEAVMPVLEQHFDGKIYSTEKHDNQISTLLDCGCGIDAIVYTDNDTFGIAHRAKSEYYPDFTIRTYRPGYKTTEIDHMRRFGIRPRYHVQTVCVDDKPIIIAIAKSMDLLHAIDDGLATKEIPAHNSGCKFVALNWKKLTDNGYNVDIINL